MSGNRTIIRATRPRFAINEIAYSKISAKKGYIEPFKIGTVEFDPARAQFRYGFLRDAIAGRNLFRGKSNEFLPINLLESELITFCEALDIHIGVLTEELSVMQIKLEENCVDGDVRLPVQNPTVDKQKIMLPTPRFGVSEVVYLRETAQVVGRLEAFRIDNIKWEHTVNEWLYIFQIRPRPRRNTTVGDREDLRRGSVVAYPESQLCTVCEAIPLAVKFLDLAVQRSQLRRSAICGTS